MSKTEINDTMIYQCRIIEIQMELKTKEHGDLKKSPTKKRKREAMNKIRGVQINRQPIQHEFFMFFSLLGWVRVTFLKIRVDPTQLEFLILLKYI